MYQLEMTADQILALQRIVQEKLKDIELSLQYDSEHNHNRPFLTKQKQDLTQALKELTDQVPF